MPSGRPAKAASKAGVVPKGREATLSKLSADKWLPEACSVSQFAGLISVGVPTVTALKAKGILRLDDKDRILVRPSLLSYLNDLRDKAAGKAESGGASLALERARLTRLQAEEQEIRNRKLRGDMLDAEEVGEAWGRVMRSVRGAVMAIPSKARMKLPHLTPTDGERIRDLCREVLEDAATEIESIADYTGGADPNEIVNE
jgi:phage terminase Nu1 subunit (DNA packaging protein)